MTENSIPGDLNLEQELGINLGPQITRYDDLELLNHRKMLKEVQAMLTKKEIPIKEAMKDPQGRQAIMEEYKSVISKVAVKLSPRDSDYELATHVATKGRFVIVKKRSGKIKARLVFRGDLEDTTLDGDMSYYAHVASLPVVRAMLMRAGRSRRRLASLDIKTAFLQTTQFGEDEPYKYMVIWNPFTEAWEYYRLLAPLYGMKSAPVRWEQTLSDFLESPEMGFRKGKNQPCIYWNPKTDLLIAVYVDDILADGDEADVKDFFEKLADRFECGEPDWLNPETPLDFIGMEVSMDSERIYLSMESYTEKALAVMGMSDCNPRAVPMPGPITDMTPLSNDQASLFRTGKGALGWLVSTMRFDLAHYSSRISQYNAEPTAGALSALKSVYRYLKGTKNLALSVPLHLTENAFSLTTDANHGSVEPIHKQKSWLGIELAMNGAPIVYSSTIAKCNVLSVGEGETLALSKGTSEFSHMCYVLEEMNIPGLTMPLPIGTDSSCAVAFAKEGQTKTRMKHIDMRDEWVQDLRNRSKVNPYHLPGTENPSDLYTKIQTKTEFLKCRDRYAVFRK